MGAVRYLMSSPLIFPCREDVKYARFRVHRTDKYCQGLDTHPKVSGMSFYLTYPVVILPVPLTARSSLSRFLLDVSSSDLIFYSLYLFIFKIIDLRNRTVPISVEYLETQQFNYKFDAFNYVLIQLDE